MTAEKRRALSVQIYQAVRARDRAQLEANRAGFRLRELLDSLPRQEREAAYRKALLAMKP